MGRWEPWRRVSVVSGDIETDLLGGGVRDTDEFNKHVADMNALGRVGSPDDSGPMIASLLSELNRWMNTQRIGVTGIREIWLAESRPTSRGDFVFAANI
ncbi:hypothetical protein [Lysobacter sp. TAB13]|uniref:hypothetical protein n=1 Tax=Lysobacter sp. TAB13 TaxID=3233065 RepID=UPI003F9B820F